MRHLGWIVFACACSSSGAQMTGDDSPGDDAPGVDAPADVDSPVDDAGPKPTQSCPYTADSAGFFTRTTAKSDYVIRLPDNYDASKSSRLVVAIHGCGDTAMNFATWGAVPYALRDTQDYIAISIGGRDGACWTLGSDVPIVEAAIEDVRSCFWVHHKKIVLAGYSSGGMMAYKMGITDASHYAGILIENSGLSAGVGNVETALTNVAWNIHVAHSARLDDQSFPIAGVRADRDKMVAHDIPLDYRELPGTHDGTSDDWSQFLLPAMTDWVAP